MTGVAIDDDWSLTSVVVVGVVVVVFVIVVLVLIAESNSSNFIQQLPMPVFIKMDGNVRQEMHTAVSHSCSLQTTVWKSRQHDENVALFYRTVCISDVINNAGVCIKYVTSQHFSALLWSNREPTCLRLGELQSEGGREDGGRTAFFYTYW